jgi:hypothetical protein
MPLFTPMIARHFLEILSSELLILRFVFTMGSFISAFVIQDITTILLFSLSFIFMMVSWTVHWKVLSFEEFFNRLNSLNLK